MEGSAGAIVAVSQIKFFLYVALLQFLLFVRSSRRSFLRTVQSIQQYGSTEWNKTDVVQTESPENFVVVFEILPIDKEWKSNKIMSCRSGVSCGFNDRNATLQVDIFPTSTTLELELFNCVLFHWTKFEFSFFFTVTVLLSRFSSEVNVVLGEVVHHKFRAHY